MPVSITGIEEVQPIIIRDSGMAHQLKFGSLKIIEMTKYSRLMPNDWIKQLAVRKNYFIL